MKALEAWGRAAYARNAHGNSHAARGHVAAWQHSYVQTLKTEPEVVARLQREYAFKQLMHGLALYVDSHAGLYDAPVQEDGYACPYVQEIAQAIIGLLSTDAGRLDCGTLDHAIREICRAGGIEL